jgi:Glucose-6-phosphate dehydrogenase, NAD binding domain
MCAVITPSSNGAGTASKTLQGRQPQPATLVIFGAGGDLTKRLVGPALYHLVQAGKLPDQFAVVGVDRNDQTTAQWRQNLTNIIQTLTPAGEIAAGATCMPDGVSPSGLDAGAPPIDFLAAV